MTTPLLPPLNIKPQQHYFPAMEGLDKWVGIAFRTGDYTNVYEDVVMAATLGSFVHCELIIGEGKIADVYSSYCEGNKLSLGFTRSVNQFFPQNWTILVHPLTDTVHAKKLALSLLGLNLPYNSRDLWQCCLQAMLPFESELDCDLPESWKPSGVFCSQMCLLFLRHLARVGELQTNITFKHHLESLHSRGCSPNGLYCMLSQYFKPLVKVVPSMGKK